MAFYASEKNESTDIWMALFFIISYKLNSFSQSLKNIPLICVWYFYLYDNSREMPLDVENESEIKLYFSFLSAFSHDCVAERIPSQLNFTHYDLTIGVSLIHGFILYGFAFCCCSCPGSIMIWKYYMKNNYTKILHESVKNKHL